MLGFILELLCGLIEVSTFSSEINGANVGAAIFVFILAGVFLNVILKYGKKIKKLRIQ
jgi:hypothetical protein